MKLMRRSFRLSLLLIVLAGAAAAAGPAEQLPGSTPPEEPAGDAVISPGVTVTSNVAKPEPTVPPLPHSQFTDCYSTHSSTGVGNIDWVSMQLCEAEMAHEERIVMEQCMNRKGQSTPPVIVQACTTLMDRNLFVGSDRYYLFANRAAAYWTLQDRSHAFADYNQAVKLAPRNAKLYYNRAAFLLAGGDTDAALRDFDTSLSLDPKLVASLLQRAKIHKARDDLEGALSDYSAALVLEPQAAAVWADRGYVHLARQDYAAAVSDESEAIRLDTKLARAYFFRGVATGGLGDASRGRSDIETAVHLDPSLRHYLTGKDGKPLLASP